MTEDETKMLERLERESKHKFAKEVVCPYCLHEFSDSWEFEESGEISCESCGKKFNMEREVEITYSTYKPS